MRVQGIIMDWAGTAVDYGCMAPVQVFLEIFREEGILPTIEEVRAPMGVLKWDHIKTMLDMPRLGKLFEQRFGRPYTAEDVDSMHEAFEPKLLEILPRYSNPIAHVVEVVDQLREDGLKIGATTGYNDTMMNIVAGKAREYGYAPDYWLTPDSVHGKGRPYPYMIYANMLQLNMGMPWQVIKVGDTASDMQEARNAGVWAVGVVKGSSMLGLTEEEVAAMEAGTLRDHIDAAKQRFIDSGAHYVIEKISHLPDIVGVVNERLREGDRPCGK